MSILMLHSVPSFPLASPPPLYISSLSPFVLLDSIALPFHSSPPPLSPLPSRPLPLTSSPNGCVWLRQRMQVAWAVISAQRRPPSPLYPPVLGSSWECAVAEDAGGMGGHISIAADGGGMGGHIGTDSTLGEGALSCSQLVALVPQLLKGRGSRRQKKVWGEGGGRGGKVKGGKGGEGAGGGEGGEEHQNVGEVEGGVSMEVNRVAGDDAMGEGDRGA
ncbi:unnamed protein product [Closterium sp. NIES-64]|nr:unnamed protein product [Closterium sp. NIES-64]CAI5968846.1 unnamed protein product [Closterium sp. NIES-64]CAI6010810.1 unnamed protein product [Closterium sp. NIES-65]